MKIAKFIWPTLGLAAAGFSCWLLYREMRSLSLDGLTGSLNAIDAHNWLLSIAAALVAYVALAGYDRIALMHLRRHVPWVFIALCSFTAYALSHNIGASVVSGAVVRYRAYATRGLSGRDVGVLVAFCSITFAIGVAMLLGLVLVLRPDIPDRFGDILPLQVSTATGIVMLVAVALYACGSFLSLPTMKIGRFSLDYPVPSVVLRQLVIGPLELLGATAIIYFALPELGNPGFVVVLGIFLLSFTIALLSHAPGGIGVLELVFIAGLSDMNSNDVLAALLVFRLFYLILPLALAIVIVLIFERGQMKAASSLQPD